MNRAGVSSAALNVPTTCPDGERMGEYEYVKYTSSDRRQHRHPPCAHTFVAVAVDYEHLILRPRGAAARAHAVVLGLYYVPYVVPDFATGLAERPRVLGGEDGEVCVVVQEVKIRAEPAGNGKMRGEHDAHRHQPRGAPRCHRPERSGRPVEVPHRLAHGGAGVKDPGHRLRTAGAYSQTVDGAVRVLRAPRASPLRFFGEAEIGRAAPKAARAMTRLASRRIRKVTGPPSALAWRGRLTRKPCPHRETVQAALTKAEPTVRGLGLTPPRSSAQCPSREMDLGARACARLPQQVRCIFGYSNRRERSRQRRAGRLASGRGNGNTLPGTIFSTTPACSSSVTKRISMFTTSPT